MPTSWIRSFGWIFLPHNLICDISVCLQRRAAMHVSYFSDFFHHFYVFMFSLRDSVAYCAGVVSSDFDVEFFRHHYSVPIYVRMISEMYFQLESHQDLNRDIRRKQAIVWICVLR